MRMLIMLTHKPLILVARLRKPLMVWLVAVRVKRGAVCL